MKENPYQYLLVKGHMTFWILLFSAALFALIVRHMPGLSSDFRDIAIPLSTWMQFSAACGVIASEVTCNKLGSAAPIGERKQSFLFKSMVAVVVAIQAVSVFI